MIYCIGKRERYDAKLASGEPVYKIGRGVRKSTFYEGGSVWQTASDAQAFIGKNKIEDTHSVYGVLADWETDTLQVSREPYRRLLKASRIVPLTGEMGAAVGGKPSDPDEEGRDGGCG